MMQQASLRLDTAYVQVHDIRYEIYKIIANKQLFYGIYKAAT